MTPILSISPMKWIQNHVLTTRPIAKDRIFSSILNFIQVCEKQFQIKPKKIPDKV